MKFFLLLLILSFRTIMGADDNDSSESTEAETSEDINLKKTLDDNLGKLQDLKKSQNTPSVQDLLKDPASRAEIRKSMKDYDGEDNANEDTDASKVRKSLESTVDENEDIIDAVPIMKSFVEVQTQVVNELSILKAEISDLKKSQEEANEVQKSLTEIVETEAELVKSISDGVEQINGIPLPVKGIGNKTEILNKSFGNSPEGSTVNYSTPVLRNALLKSFEAGKVDGLVISKWEHSGYRQAAIPQSVMAAISEHLPKQEALV